MTDDTHWPADAPNPFDHDYMGFKFGTEYELIRLKFLDKYGKYPQHIIEYAGILWAGPVNKREEDR